MNLLPDPDPLHQEPSPASAWSEAHPPAPFPEEEGGAPEPPESAFQASNPRDGSDTQPLLFQSFLQLEPLNAPRIPHMGHLCLLLALAFAGAVTASLLTRAALYFHLFGVSTIKQAITDIHYTLGGMAVLYLVTFGAAYFVFPALWHKGFFGGVQLRIHTALHLRRRLFGAAVLCFLLALANGMLMPGPKDTPIDQIFRSPGAAWLMFFFGISMAPFFEEMIFRGFLLPALCTSWDWAAERLTGGYSLGADENGHPEWSTKAMVFGSIFTSIPFALMHADQTGRAVGPLLLLMLVSLALCWIRLITRSLAASMLMHASYNFLLFSMMLIGTGGFRHLSHM